MDEDPYTAWRLIWKLLKLIWKHRSNRLVVASTDYSRRYRETIVICGVYSEPADFEADGVPAAFVLDGYQMTGDEYEEMA